MRQLTCTGPGALAWHDVDPPPLDAEAALVRPLAVARCDIDLLFLSGLAGPKPPFAVGHECVAEVAEVGDAVRTVAPGDRVVVPFQISCGTCGRCRRGLTAGCERVPFRASYGMPISDRDWGGALSDLLRVPFADGMLVHAPAGVPATVLAGVGDNIADGWRSVAPHLAERPGASVLVVGAPDSAVGLYAVDVARALGAGRVDYLAPGGAGLPIAERLGAHVIQSDYDARPGRYDVTVNATIDVAALALALHATDVGGVCTSIGPYPMPEVPIPLSGMYSRGVTFLTGRVQSRAAMPEVLALLASGKLRVPEITTRIVEWEEAPAAMLEPEVKLVVRRAGVA